MIKVYEKDYIVLMTEGENPIPQLWKVQEVLTNGDIRVRQERDPHINHFQSTVTPDKVICSLGPKPPKGLKVGNLDVNEIYRKCIEAQPVNLYLFGYPKKAAVQKYLKAMQYAEKVLTKAGLSKLLDLETVFELRPKRGKWAGYFKASKDIEAMPHRIIMSYDYVMQEGAVPEYVVLHELSHLLDHCLSDYEELKNQWLALYVQTVKPVRVSGKECSSLFRSLSQHEITEDTKHVCREWLVKLDDEEKAKANAIFRWIKSQRHVDTKSLNYALRKGKVEVLTEVWPTFSIDTKSDLKPAVSEYACVAVQELFAEAMAFHFTHRELPKAAKRLVENTLSIARNHFKD
jgi:hypothetical protein